MLNCSQKPIPGWGGRRSAKREGMAEEGPQGQGTGGGLGTGTAEWEGVLTVQLPLTALRP